MVMVVEMVVNYGTYRCSYWLCDHRGLWVDSLVVMSVLVVSAFPVSGSVFVVVVRGCLRVVLVVVSMSVVGCGDCWRN